MAARPRRSEVRLLSEKEDSQLCKLLDLPYGGIVELSGEGQTWYRDEDHPGVVWSRAAVRVGGEQPNLPYTQTGALYGFKFLRSLAAGTAGSETSAAKEAQIQKLAAQLCHLLDSGNSIWDT